jgi:hypothetical protein
MSMVTLSYRNVCQQGFDLVDLVDAGQLQAHFAHLALR